MDYSSLTSSEPDYLCWLFDVNMNYMINFNTIPLAIKKGPEFLQRRSDYDGINLITSDNQMMFDVMESRGPVNELAAMIRDIGCWEFFVTLTCNDSMTPGVCSIYNHVMECSGDSTMSVSDQKKWKMRILAAASPVLLKAWYRYVKHFWVWAQKGPDLPFGLIRALWFR